MTNRSHAVLVFGAAILLAFSAFGVGLLISSPANHAEKLGFLQQEWVVGSTDESRNLKRPICEKKSDAVSSGLCSQWRSTIAAEDSAYWAKWAFFISAWGVLGLLATIMQGRRALERAAEANSIARETSYNDSRPWLNIKNIRFHTAIVAPPQLVLTIEIEFQNYGNLAASNVKIQLFAAKLFDKSMQDVLRGEADTQVSSRYSDIIMPGECKKETLVGIYNLDELIRPECGVFSLGVIVKFAGPSGSPSHILTQMWNVGASVALNQLQPFDAKMFTEPSALNPSAVLQKTFKLT